MIKNVLDYLENSVNQYPDKIAFSDQENQITYKELKRQAQSIGSRIISLLNKKTKQPIVVFIDRDITGPIAFMGVIYSGNYYVPVDCLIPRNRIISIIKTTKPQAIIAQRDVSDLLDDIDFQGHIILFKDTVNHSIDDANLLRIRNASINTDPLYAIFTSGSTGIPKGVLISHQSVINLIENFKEIFNFSDENIFGNQAPFDFDVSVKDIYSTLKNGATMHVIPKVMFSFPGKLIEYLNRKKINTIIWATSALRIVANLKALKNKVPQYLKRIMFSGEVMPNKVLNYWRKHLPEPTYINLYGPTEITCNCTYYHVGRFFSDNDMLPIGIPFPNTDIIVLDEDNKEVGVNEIGEICVRGTSLALGYINNPEETSRSFCQNPLNSHYAELIYRTGDLGKYNRLGELLFLSRKDSQIKHMGHRIELGEIELAANSLDFLEAAFCVYDKKKEEIVLYYQASDNLDKEIVQHLRDDLPKFMIPTKLIQHKSFPLNKNGKIDRKKISLMGK